MMQKSQGQMLTCLATSTSGRPHCNQFNFGTFLWRVSLQKFNAHNSVQILNLPHIFQCQRTINDVMMSCGVSLHPHHVLKNSNLSAPVDSAGPSCQNACEPNRQTSACFQCPGILSSLRLDRLLDMVDAHNKSNSSSSKATTPPNTLASAQQLLPLRLKSDHFESDAMHTSMVSIVPPGVPNLLAVPSSVYRKQLLDKSVVHSSSSLYLTERSWSCNLCAQTHCNQGNERAPSRQSKRD